MTEWSFTSDKAYRDPFDDVTLDMAFTDPDGEEHRVPAFFLSGEKPTYLQQGGDYGSSKYPSNIYRSATE